MKSLFSLLVLCVLVLPASAQTADAYLTNLPQLKDYVQKRSSSFDRSGANADARQIAPGATLTLLDADGPAIVSHIWVTIASGDPNHLKGLVLRMYWDGESTPSVETPVGDFFGVGHSKLTSYSCAVLNISANAGHPRHD